MMQAKYPGDQRNGKAADTLQLLASQTGELSDGAWHKLQKHYSFSSVAWSDAVSLASRHVEFQRNVRTFPAYVSNLLCILEDQSALATTG